MRKITVLATLGFFLLGFAWSVTAKEKQIGSGDIIIVRLAPRDPRAFLLGDYMALNYDLNQQVDKALYAKYSEGQNPRWNRGTSEETGYIPRDGVAIVCLDDAGIATFIRLDDGENLTPDEHRLYFRYRDGGAKVAASSYYFQEGYAKDFERAEYGELRVDKSGKSLLMYMLDKDMQRIQPHVKKSD